MSDINKMKQSFEKHATHWNYNLSVDEAGIYEDLLTQRMYEAYEKAWKSAQIEWREHEIDKRMHDEFEYYAKMRKYNLKQTENGYYEVPLTNRAWTAFSAAWRDARK